MITLNGKVGGTIKSFSPYKNDFTRTREHEENTRLRFGKKQKEQAKNNLRLKS